METTRQISFAQPSFFAQMVSVCIGLIFSIEKKLMYIANVYNQRPKKEGLTVLPWEEGHIVRLQVSHPDRYFVYFDKNTGSKKTVLGGEAIYQKNQHGLFVKRFNPLQYYQLFARDGNVEIKNKAKLNEESQPKFRSHVDALQETLARKLQTDEEKTLLRKDLNKENLPFVINLNEQTHKEITLVKVEKRLGQPNDFYKRIKTK